MPYFSIIIPMYNRANLIGRTLESCLSQDFSDFEIIVVDDGSSDDSTAVVESYTDQRIKLLRHEINQGVSPARNTGINVCCGQWVICHDSDDELTPGALSISYEKTLEIGEDIDALRFMCRLEYGDLSPDPPLREEVWDYEGYIRSLEKYFARRSEMGLIVRRSTFDRVRYPEGRQLEWIYHLDFAYCFRIKTYPEIIRLYHQDADNQLTRPSMSHLFLTAADRIKEGELLLARHGEALVKWAPRTYLSLLIGLATFNFLLGKRVQGLRYMVQSFRINPFNPKVFGVMIIGLLGPRPLAWLKSLRAKRAKLS